MRAVKLGYRAPPPPVRRSFRHPDLIALPASVDGRPKPAPLCTSWHINKFLKPDQRRAVLDRCCT